LKTEFTKLSDSVSPEIKLLKGFFYLLAEPVVKYKIAAAYPQGI
jgi:hypothetical protein